jgi:hypothetical protein
MSDRNTERFPALPTWRSPGWTMDAALAVGSTLVVFGFLLSWSYSSCDPDGSLQVEYGEPGSVCGAIGGPGAPEDWGDWLALSGLFGLPVLIVFGVTAIAFRRRSRALLLRGIVLGGVMALALLAWILLGPTPEYTSAV